MNYESASDGDVVAACRTGDADAWRELVRRFSRYVHAIATQAYRLGPEDAEDVFQEVFARTYSHLENLRDDDAIRPWIGQLTRRLCLDRLRRDRHEDPIDDVDPPDPTDAISQLDDAMFVREALRQLPQACQDILDRFFCRDESYVTIASALSLPAGTIASRISRCLARLREHIAGRSPSSAASSDQR
jgi:RNA polymerase sigma-70 factor (ECF subfamily)